MLICLFLCAAAVLPSAFSQPDGSPKIPPSSSPAQRYADAAADAMRSLQRLHELLRRLQNGEPLDFNESTNDDNSPLGFWTMNQSPLKQVIETINSDRSLRSNIVSRGVESMGDGQFLRGSVVDSIGGGHLLRRSSGLDSIGGGHLLKRDRGMSGLDSIGGGHLLKRNEFSNYNSNFYRFIPNYEENYPVSLGTRQLDSIGGGHLLKRQH